MKSEFKKFIDNKYIVFSVDIGQKYVENKKIWKKEPKMKKDWQNFTLSNTYFNANFNGLALLTGKINNLFIIDIDNIEHWTNFLKENNQEEPKTVSVISGSGGKHLYFKYTDDLDEITSKDHKFGIEYDIDIKANGGCIYAPPTKYYNNNVKKEVMYKWENDIFECEMIEVPVWIKNILFCKINNKKNMKANDIIPIKNNTCDIDANDENINFNEDDIEILIDMLSINRCNTYEGWTQVGMCLYNINKMYMLLWKKWSKKSNNYNENEDFNSKWKSFGKVPNKKLKLGSLLYWCKQDNPIKYDNFMKTKKVKQLIVAKFPDKKLILGDTLAVSKQCSYMSLNNKECFLYGDIHVDSELSSTMYIEMIKDLITIKCKHPACFGKIYPCEHVQLSKQEMNIAFNGDVNITINNNCKDDELVDFQLVNLFDDENLNELIYNGMNGKPTPLAEIIYYYKKNEYMYAEDDKWYFFENHRWKIAPTKNAKLRYSICEILKSKYSKVLEYYINTEGKSSTKAKILKNNINNLDGSSIKDDIMKELGCIFTVKNNKNGDFTKKFNSNDFLICFNNGVYDLKTHEFRDGKPDDYITLTTGYDFVNKYSENYDKLLNFLNDIQPNKEELDYLLTYISTALFGNTLELFTVLTGSGRNGKSKILDLLSKTFGEYYGNIQSQTLTSQIKEGDAPAPGILDLLYKKIVVASETLEGAKLNSGFIKFITGRDSATFRMCHQNNMIKFKAKFITLLACNNIPECDKLDSALSRRLRCIHFPTEFVEFENQIKKPNQKLQNETIDLYFNDWKQDFMLLLLEYYKKYEITKKLFPTSNILKWTEQYKEDTDLYLQFLNECTEESEKHIHTVVLYERFKSWFKNNNPNMKIPNNRNFTTELKKYKNIENIKIDGKSSSGIKKLQLIDEI